MDARVHPRTSHSISVGLYCPEKDQFQNGKVRDISTEGLFFTGTPCARTGTQFSVVVNPRNPDKSLTLSARVVRHTSNGFALRFHNISQQARQQLEEIIWPSWDGKDVFEGLLIVAAHENTGSFSGWLRLTSMLFNYRRIWCHTNKNDPSCKTGSRHNPKSLS
jgi:hypothetical protein